MIRVLLVSPLFPPSYSGAGRQAAAIMGELPDSFRFTVWTLGDSPRPLHSDSAAGHAPIEVIHLTSKDRPGYGRRFGWQVGQRLLRERFDLLWIQGVGPASYAALVAARARKIPTVIKITLEGQDDPVSLRARPWGRWRLAILRSATRIVCPSQRLHQLCLESGIEANRVRHLPNGVDLGKFNPPSADGGRDRHSVVWVGAIQERKQPHRVIEVVRPLLIEFPDLQIHFVGGPGRTEADRDYDREFRGRIDEALLPHVHFHGFVDDPASIVSGAGFLLHPSRAEGLPNAVLEAMAAGTIPLVNNLPALAEAVDETVGRLLPEDDPGAWTRALRDLLGNKAEQDRLRTAGRRRVEQVFDLRRIAEAYGDLFREIAGPDRS